MPSIFDEICYFWTLVHQLILSRLVSLLLFFEQCYCYENLTKLIKHECGWVLFLKINKPIYNNFNESPNHNLRITRLSPLLLPIIINVFSNVYPYESSHRDLLRNICPTGVHSQKMLICLRHRSLLENRMCSRTR